MSTTILRSYALPGASYSFSSKAEVTTIDKEYSFILYIDKAREVNLYIDQKRLYDLEI